MILMQLVCIALLHLEGVSLTDVCFTGQRLNTYIIFIHTTEFVRWISLVKMKLIGKLCVTTGTGTVGLRTSPQCPF